MINLLNPPKKASNHILLSITPNSPTGKTRQKSEPCCQISVLITLHLKCKYNNFSDTKLIKIVNYNSGLEIQHIIEPQLCFIAQATMEPSKIIKSKQAQQYNRAFKVEICPQFKSNKRSICFRSLWLKIVLDK